MPAWLIPALKAVIPHIGTILSTAAPVFTKKHLNTVPDQSQFLQEQITELQAVATANAAHVKALAAQMQTTVAALEEAARVAERKFTQLLYLSAAAAVLSVLAVGAVAFALLS